MIVFISLGWPFFQFLYPAIFWRHHIFALVRVNSNPSTNAASSVGLKTTFAISSTSSGQSNFPDSSLFAQSQSPDPSKYKSFSRVLPALQKAKRCPLVGSLSNRPFTSP